MKVLAVLAQPPLPEGGPAGRCALAMMRGLGAHGIEVSAVVASQHFSIPGHLPDDIQLDIVTVEPDGRGIGARLDQLRHPRGELGRGEFAARVREAARHVDVVHLEEPETARCGIGLDPPCLVRVHYLVREDRPLGVPWRRHFRQVIEFARAERWAARNHRYLVPNSAPMARSLRAMAPSAEVVVVPLALDTRYYRPAPLDGPPTVGIIGSASWPPTAAGIDRLVERVWPLVLRRVPEARLVVAGRGTTALHGLGDTAGVEVVGEVTSAAEFLRGLSVLVFPLGRGSGTKVKVLEALATGLPVVTTSRGAEGIEASAGVVVKEEDEQLAAATAQILLDRSERVERGSAARAAFERRHSPEAATAPLADLYRLMARG